MINRYSVTISDIHSKFNSLLPIKIPDQIIFIRSGIFTKFYLDIEAPNLVTPGTAIYRSSEITSDATNFSFS